jgi:hypothetical protein
VVSHSHKMDSSSESLAGSNYGCVTFVVVVDLSRVCVHKAFQSISADLGSGLCSHIHYDIKCQPALLLMLCECGSWSHMLLDTARVSQNALEEAEERVYESRSPLHTHTHTAH